jgi:hypothetical protein
VSLAIPLAPTREFTSFDDCDLGKTFDIISDDHTVQLEDNASLELATQNY